MKDLIPYNPSTDPSISITLLSLGKLIRDTAMENIEEAIKSHHYTGPQRLAMLRFQELKLVGGLDLAAVLIRGNILKDIEDKHLWTVHPEMFNSLEDAASYYKISKSLLHNVRDWYNIIFPYFQENGISVAEVWEDVGYSNLRELTPTLKSIITGDDSKRETVKLAVEKIYDDIEITEQSSGEIIDPEEKKLEAVNWALSAGQTTQKEIRKTLRPQPPIDATIISRNGSRFVVAEMDDRQADLLTGPLGSHFDFVYTNEAPTQVPVVKKLLGG